MAWFKVSDDWIDHPKVQRAGRNGRALWIAAGNRCAKYASDGLVERDLLRTYASLAEVPAPSTAKKLVEVGLWHDHETLKKCTTCKAAIEAINRERASLDEPRLVVGDGDYYFHDWAAHQLPKHRTLSPEAKAADDRLRALKKDRGLCEEIQKRDRSRCRYCGRQVNWKARRGDAYATYDHVDPWCFAPNGGNYLEGVVTACGDCNGRKGQRTAAEWEADGGLPLRSPGWRAGDPWPPNQLAPTAPRPLPATPDLPENGENLELENAANSDEISSVERARNPVGFSASCTPPHPLPPGQGSSSGPSPDLARFDSRSSPSRAHGRARARLGPGRVGPDPGLGPGLGPDLAGLGLVGLVRVGTGAPPGASSAVSGETSSAVEESDG